MLKSLRSLLAVLCLHLLSLSLVQAQSNRIWWVSTDGNNSNTGSFSSPFRNIQFAVNNALDHDTIIAKAGAYVEIVTFSTTKSVTLGSQYLLTGDTNYINNTSIEGSSTVKSSSGLIRNFPTSSTRQAIVGLTVQNAIDVVFSLYSADIRRLVVKNNNAESFSSYLGRFTNCAIDSSVFSNNGLTTFYSNSTSLSNSTVKNSLVKNNKTNTGVFEIQSGTNIENNKFYDNGTFYIGSYSGNALNIFSSSGNNRIINNEFIRNLGNAINVGDYGNNVLVANNTFYGNNRSLSISPSSPSQNKLYFYNNLVTGSKSSNVNLNGSPFPKPITVFKNNVIGYSFTRLGDIPNISAIDTTGSENNYGFYPQYIDSANSNFRLSNTSPAISKGTLELAPVKDILGSARPLPAGSNPDIGAHESPIGIVTQKAVTTITAINPGNKRDTIYWNHTPDTLGVRKFKLYRGTKSGSYTAITDSISRSSTRYIDSIALFNDTTYYYKISAIDTAGVEVTSSNEKTVTPVNKLPKADRVAINNEFVGIGRNLEKVVNVSSNNSFDPDGTIVSTEWLLNGVRVATGASVQISIKQGTNLLSLVVEDNDGGKDTATFTKTYYASSATTNTNVNTGLSAFNNNNILYADVTNNTNRIFRVDSLLQPNFAGGPSALAVNNPVISSPSVTPDSIMFIPNGTSIDAFRVTGSSWFNSSAALGGNVQVLPTIDTALKRVYLGLDNGMWIGLDYSSKSPSTKWSYYSQAQNNGFSAPGVITKDRKLVYTTISGNITAFDLNSLNINNPEPKWNYNLGRNVRKAMSVDGADNIVIVDELGYVNKFSLGSNGEVVLVWSKKLSNTLFNTSVVIDGLNDYYVGTDNGRIVKLSGSTGDTIWSYNSLSSITATPALSNYGSIYFGNQNGEVYSLQTETGLKNWYFKLDERSPVSSHLLHINGATYFTTATTKKIYQLWDKSVGTGSINPSLTGKSLAGANATAVTTMQPLEPTWSSFQGDYRRTGQSTKIISIFTFKGSGMWSNPSSWENNIVPPYVLPVGYVIIIDPSGNGECIVEQPVIVNGGSSLEVKPGKKLIFNK